MNIDQAIIAVVITFNFILFLAVLMGGRGRVNIVFSALIFFITLWSTTNYLADILSSEIAVHILVGLTYAAAIIIVTLFLRFVSLFPDNEKGGFSRFEVIFYPISILFVGFSFSKLIVEQVFIGEVKNSLVTGPAITGYTIYLILVVLVAFSILLKKYFKLNGVQKNQIIYVIIGSLLTVLGAVITNLIIPLMTQNYTITKYGPYFSLFLIVFSSYAILKHHLFSVKVIATELITFALWVFVLARIIIADNMEEQIINGGLLLILVVFGIVLIKSVIKEVNQREKIELLATDLQKANDRLRELDRQKSEFVSFATHQLRAPLTAMKGYASLILEGDLGKLSHEIRGAITRIYDSSNTLANIVDDYLNISRIELGSMKYSFEPVDLKDLLDHVIGELRPNIEKSGLTFEINVNRERNYMVSIDKDKFKQIIANLVDNAMKYTPAGTISINLTSRRDGTGNKVVFSVKDNGIGIAPEVMPQLFAKFSRAENGTRQNIHGTGLGLYVAKEIVTAHKGRIWAESPGEGRGSTFCVELDEII